MECELPHLWNDVQLLVVKVYARPLLLPRAYIYTWLQKCCIYRVWDLFLINCTTKSPKPLHILSLHSGLQQICIPHGRLFWRDIEMHHLNTNTQHPCTVVSVKTTPTLWWWWPSLASKAENTRLCHNHSPKYYSWPLRQGSKHSINHEAITINRRTLSSSGGACISGFRETIRTWKCEKI